jgi:hypothetical protein
LITVGSVQNLTICSNLRHLNIIDACNDAIHDLCIQTISESFSNTLETVELKNCNCVGDDGIRALVQCNRLFSLNLDKCTSITTVGMEILCKHLGHQLITLNLSGCIQFSLIFTSFRFSSKGDSYKCSAMLSIANHCKKIQNLNFALWTFDTISLAYLAKMCGDSLLGVLNTIRELTL